MAAAALAPVVRGSRLPRPGYVVAVGLGFGVAAAGAAALEWWWAALVLWLANRVADGLDGAIARATGRTSDAGAYADMCADMAVYVLVPLGVAVGRHDDATWIAAAVLLGSFAFNAITWSYLAALLERRGRGAAHQGEVTGVTMTPGLVEGTETIVWFALLLAVPSFAPWWMGTMAAATAAGAVQRFAAAHRDLRRSDVGGTS